MKRLKQLIKSDIWILILDILAVNMAYVLALRFRFAVNPPTEAEAARFINTLYHFAPIYTAVCLLVFFLFRMYNGMWLYAGLSDMFRITGASAVTCVFHLVYTLLIGRRMPWSYYVFGAAFQFVFISVIRFAYRIVFVERRKHGEKAGTALVVGAGEMGRQTKRLLDDGMVFRVACMVDTEDEYVGQKVDGVHVYALNEMEAALDKFRVDCVFLAEPDLKKSVREEIGQLCSGKKIELRDYNSFFSYSGELESNVAVVKEPEGRKSIPFSPPDISGSEIGEVVEALKSGWITTGPRTKLLERRLAAYIETGRTDVDTESETSRWSNRVVCLNSATAAEEMNMRVFGIGPGDEVLVPAYTYTASASAAIHCGATVKFIDIQKDGDPVTHMPEMDYEKLEEAITDKTKAVVVVDLGGIVADYERIFEIVEKKKILFQPKESDDTPLGDLNSRIQKAIGRVAVFADCAHALGGSRMFHGEKRCCGALADFTDFSFHAVKNFTTAEGGASTWRPIKGVENAEIYHMYQLLSLHGQSKDALAKTKVGAWEYDIVGPWYKCNMTDIMAAIGLRQLDRYPGLLARRESIIRKYDAACDELGLDHLLHHVEGMDSSNHLYLVRVPGFTVEQRNDLITRMAEAGVATNVHYKPLPMMTAYKALGWDVKDFPNTYDYYHNLFTLPLHTLLSDEDVDFVCKTLKTVVKEMQE